MRRKYLAAGWLALALVLLAMTVRADVNEGKDDDDDDDEDDFGDDYKWKIVFYTGDRTWAGTDSQIYFQVIGDKGASPIQLIPSSRSNFEVNSIDSFAIRNINLNKVGQVKSIVVGKQHSLAFFNDWQLIKVELYDNTKEHSKKYVFNCNCWLTTTKFKQIIPLEFVGVHTPIQPVTQRGSKLFPLLVGLLLLLLILTMVSYFTNIVCKRWREIQELNSDRELASSFTENRLRRHRRQNQTGNEASATTSGDRPARTDSYHPFKPTLPDSAGLDKPPEYCELFPASSTTKINSADSDAAATATATVVVVASPAVASATDDSAHHVNETTPIIQPASQASSLTANSHVIQLTESGTNHQHSSENHSTSIELAEGGQSARSNRKPTA